VNLQDARCNNKDNMMCLTWAVLSFYYWTLTHRDVFNQKETTHKYCAGTELELSWKHESTIVKTLSAGWLLEMERGRGDETDAPQLDSSWKVMAHGDAREGKWRGNWRMEWVASTLHTTSEHGVSSITNRWCAHLGCQQSTELTPPPI